MPILLPTLLFAASSLAQTPAGKPAGAPDSPFKTVELDHISYQVNDYRVTRDFYAELMGMEVKNDNGKTQCELYFGNSMLLARTLGIRVDEACFAKPLEEQSSCLTRNTDNLVLDDGHSQSMVTALASGPSSDLAGPPEVYVRGAPPPPRVTPPAGSGGSGSPPPGAATCGARRR